MLVVGIIQTIASVILSLVGIMVAYLIYKVQRDRNTPKLVLVTRRVIGGRRTRGRMLRNTNSECRFGSSSKRQFSHGHRGMAGRKGNTLQIP